MRRMTSKRLGRWISRTTQSPSVKPFRPRIEPLEPRQLLAAMPIITELVAENDGSLLDGNFEASDWIELYNAGNEAADLTGWHLTDNEDLPTKWTFPATSLAVGEYLVVFASGNDGPDTAGNLHTNFRLDNDGEYLALLTPGGAAVASEFSPAFPPLTSGVSHGIEQTVTESVLVEFGSAATALVPDASDDALIGSTWTGAAFVEGAAGESAWTPVTTGVGFDDGPSGGGEPIPDDAFDRNTRGILRLPNPIISDHSQEYNASYLAENVFDQDFSTHYASLTQGADTFMEFDFLAETTISAFMHHNRSAHVLDQVTSSTLTFSTDAVFDAGDTVIAITHTEQVTPMAYEFEPQTARFVRWDVTGVVAGGENGNQGAKEMAFFGPSGPLAQLADPAVINSATPYNAGFVATNVLDDNAGSEYASLGLGAATFIDFDFGEPTTLAGFEFLDRFGYLDEIFYSKLVFADDPSFSTPTGEYELHHGGRTVERLFGFPEQTARYVRWQVTETYNNVNTNAGAKEIGFYAPIPSYLAPVNPTSIDNGATAHGATVAPLWNTGSFPASNLFDDNLATEYASFASGTVSAPLANDGTFLEFDFGQTRNLAAFEHLDRLPLIDQTATSTLYFSVDPTFELSDPSVTIEHGGAFAFETFSAIPARYVRWEVNEMAPGNTGNLGGKEMRFYEDPIPPSYDDLLGIDVQAEMFETNGSAYVRIPFDVPGDPADFDRLTLSMQYDDGFVAYLNGTEVARRNADDPLSWNSIAAGNRDRRTALVAEQIDISAFIGSLNSGGNILAVHGLNSAVDDPEMLALPELAATDVGGVGGGPWQFFETPTPGQANGSGLSGIAEAPVFSRPSGTYAGPISIELTVETPGAVIRYTNDGTVPTEASSVYAGPISLSSSAVITARSFSDTLVDSASATETFVALSADVTGFDSNLPLVVIDTLGSTVGQTSYTGVFTSFIDTTPAGRAAITGDADFTGRGGLRIRGSSSTSFPKKQYAFETWDENDQDLSVSILGMPAESDWILYAPYSDKSLMRNYLSYTWDGAMGRWAPRMKFVEVFYNTNGDAVTSSDYAGVYVFMEKIKRDNDRVDIARLDASDIAEPDVSGGYILKVDRLDPGDAGFRTDSGLLMGYVEPKEAEIAPEQAAWIQNYLNEMEAALYGPDFANPESGYTAYIDVDSFIDHQIIVEMTRNIDEFRLSAFYSKDRDGKLAAGPAWDYNLALGNVNHWDGQYTGQINDQGQQIPGWYHDFLGLLPAEQDTTGHPHAGLGYPSYEWYRRMFDDPEFELRYWDRWFALREDRFRTDTLLAEIDQTAAFLEESQQRNFQQWPILGTYVWPNYDWQGNTYADEVDFVKTWLTGRLAWIDAQFGAPPAFNQDGGRIDPGFDLTMTAAGGGTVYYTTDGTDPRVPTEVSTFTLVDRDAPKRVLIPDVDDDVALGLSWTNVADPAGYDAWIQGTGGVGYDEQTTYADLIDVDLMVPMNDVNTTAYIRVPFTVESGSLAELDELTLRMMYDDGFVAYINGTKVAERNPPASAPTWNSTAGGDHADAAALVFEPIDISQHLSTLVAGDNVLAIHGLNSGITSSDMLIVAELSAVDTAEPAVSPTAEAYAGAVTLLQSTPVKARVLDGGQWSALKQATFAIDPAAPGNLVVSEIHYNPNVPTDAELLQIPGLSNNDFEFIELQNIADHTVYVGGISFVAGDPVDFTLAETAEANLAPGETALIVSSRAAFELRFGTSVSGRIVGQFTDGRIGNSGEWINLLAADGQTIQSFRFNDRPPWPTEPDGGGASLQLIAPEANPDHADGLNWIGTDPTPGQVLPTMLVGRHVYYAGSAFGSDDASIATDKTALMPGQTATAANFTNYSEGVNGVIFDVAGAEAILSLDVADLGLAVGNTLDPNSWPAASEPDIAIRPGQGRGGSDRIVLTWPDQAPQDAWLRVTVPTTAAAIGLLEDDVFFFGNAVGEVTTPLGAGLPTPPSGPTEGLPALALVNASDVIAIRDNPRGEANPAAIDDPHDVNRDGFVDAIDLILARDHATGPLAALRLLAPSVTPAEPAPPAESEGRAESGERKAESGTRATMAATKPRSDVNRVEVSSRLSDDLPWWEEL